MNRRVHMRAVMRGKLDLLDRPALAVGQILLAQTWKQLEQKRRGLGIADILDLRPHERRIVDRFVFERRRQIDDPAGQFHCFPVCAFAALGFAGFFGFGLLVCSVAARSLLTISAILAMTWAWSR